MIRRLSAEPLIGWGMTYAGIPTWISDNVCQWNTTKLCLKFPTSVGAGPSDHSQRCTEEDFDIEPRTPHSGILQVESNHGIEVDSTSTRNLPQSRDSRFYFEQPATVPCLVSGQFIRNWRPWPDK